LEKTKQIGHGKREGRENGKYNDVRESKTIKESAAENSGRRRRSETVRGQKQ